MANTLKEYEDIGRMIREIKSNHRCIQRYKKENEEFVEKLSTLIGRPVTLEEVLASGEDEF